MRNEQNAGGVFEHATVKAFGLAETVDHKNHSSGKSTRSRPLGAQMFKNAGKFNPKECIRLKEVEGYCLWTCGSVSSDPVEIVGRRLVYVAKQTV